MVANAQGGAQRSSEIVRLYPKVAVRATIDELSSKDQPGK